ncbi:relaxase/mobilization nuclease domain-containing protein [Cronobacter sakazakii]|uniref:relaxase/mobilization nuclease domain-containing protein n=1 Tax=Cronobacter sakazakii TaxID=28141 RepID=UPI000CF07D36|nr:relaxase/mobilization nuclease domain-containing protein [Cronobacter sakazakii]PPY46151.1 relaxase NikB [Cronobacter sakazakii]PRO57753.1 relaxase NikB [Cronobacter sakazakii]
MIPVIPPKRQDGKSSFGDLVSYVSVRDEPRDDDLMEAVKASGTKPEMPHSSRFSRLVDYATKLRDESFISLVDVMPDGGEWVNFYGVTCFHNCTSIESAAEEMEFSARKAKFAHNKSDPVFHYILSWQSHESPRPEQIYDSVSHTLSRLGLAGHQFVAAVHTDTDNLHVHIAVNRVHPETGYLNRLAYSQEKLSKACRELELKHGFSPDNGCYVIAPDNRIVRRTSVERDRLSAWKRGRNQSLREYIADTAIAGLRESPVTDWPSLHQRFAKEGLFLTKESGELKVKDGWERERPGVTLSAFGHAFDTDKLIRKLGEFIPPAQDIFSQVPAVGRYEPDKIIMPSRPERMTEKESLSDYAIARLRAPLIALDQDPTQRTIQSVHTLLAQSGLYLKEQHDRLVICDGYDSTRTPVRAERVWPALTKAILDSYKGGWQPVPKDIFQQVPPAEQFTGGGLEATPVSDREWRKLRTGSGPQGALKREIFSDKESLWGYAVSHCRQDIETLISSGEFTWARCHELLARQGLLLMREQQGLVVMDAYNHEQTPVKASHVHPDLTLARAEPHAGSFVSVSADIFERVKPVSRYNPELAVSDRDIPGMKRDPELRRQRREARAAAREDLKARYAAWRANWQRPDLHGRERYQAIHDECRMRKARIRIEHRDPLVRKLHYHIAELQRMQALIALKETMKAERAELIGQGKWYPPSYRQWVEAEAVKGDKAAISQLRGWDYRDRRGNAVKSTTDNRCVVICEPGGTPMYSGVPGLRASLKKNGRVQFRDPDTGRHICTDYGDRVIFRNSGDYDALKRDMVKVAPVLFSRSPSVAMAPEGNNEQFNTAFAKMVAWHNVNHGDDGEYHIARPDVDQLRVEHEQQFTNVLNQSSYAPDAKASHQNTWEPPTPR